MLTDLLNGGVVFSDGHSITFFSKYATPPLDTLAASIRESHTSRAVELFGVTILGETIVAISRYIR